MTLAEVQRLFTYEHLPEHLQAVSLQFYTLAVDMWKDTPPSAERVLMIRKLWEAKNLAVWCASTLGKDDE